MSELIFEGLEITDEICQKIKYDPNVSEVNYYISKTDAQVMKPFFVQLKLKFKDRKLVFSPEEYHPSRYYFGSEDPEVNSEIADIFDIADSPYRSGDDFSIAPVYSEKPKVLNYYPWEQLKKVGDHFLVLNCDPRTLSVYASAQAKSDGRTYRVHKTSSPAEFIVVLIEGPGLAPMLIVEK